MGIPIKNYLMRTGFFWYGCRNYKGFTGFY